MCVCVCVCVWVCVCVCEAGLCVCVVGGERVVPFEEKEHECIGMSLAVTEWFSTLRDL